MDNLGWYYLAHWYPTYVIGVAAGHLSKTGKLGYVASFPVASVYRIDQRLPDGRALASTRTPTLQTIVINSWFDPQAATQAGTALIDNGCDFLFGIMDEAGYLQVAEKRGVWAAMWNTDIRRYGPKSYVSSVLIDFRQVLCRSGRQAPRRHLDAERARCLPMGAGVDRDKWGEKVPADVAAAADAVRDKILGGWSPVRRRDQGLQGQGHGRRRAEDDRPGTLQLGLVDRRRHRPVRLIPSTPPIRDPAWRPGPLHSIPVPFDD